MTSFRTWRCPVNRLFISLAAVLVMVPALGAPALGADAILGRVTLRIRPEPGFEAADLGRILADEGFVGSVTPDMRPVPELDEHDPPDGDGRTHVHARTPGSEILTIEVLGRDEKTVKAHLNALLASLRALRTASDPDGQGRIAAMEARVAEAERVLAEASAERTKFLDQYGGLDPAARLEIVRDALKQRTIERMDLDVSAAGDRAVRDYLAEALEKEPSSVVRVRDDLIAVESEILAEKKRLADLLEARNETHPLVVEQRGRIETLERTLRDPPRVETESAWHAALSDELFKTDRNLVTTESRRKFLAESIAALDEEARDLALIVVEWDDLLQRVRERGHRAQIVRQQLEELRENAIFQKSAEWAWVVAGPTFGKR